MGFKIVTNENFHYFCNEVCESTKYIRNEIPTNLTKTKKNVKKPLLSKCTVYCGYQLKNVFLYSQRHENLIRDGMRAKDRKAQETLVYERKKSQAHRLAKR